MVVAEWEVDSSMQSEQTPKNQTMSSLGRQSSIYALTLDEFQHRLCEEGKNFGSMNTDELLSSIWNVEENQTIIVNNNNNSDDEGTRKQPSLSRQGSLTIPTPLSRKTVDQVWSEIHNQRPTPTTTTMAMLATMYGIPSLPSPAHLRGDDSGGFLDQSRGNSGTVSYACSVRVYPNNKPEMGPTFIGYSGNGKRDASGYPPPEVCYGGGGYGAAAAGSPVSSEGMAARENAAADSTG